MVTRTRPIFGNAAGWATTIGSALVLACAPGGGSNHADNGGMSGTGVSQGSISSFGSIFVNGVQWDVSGATIEIDGVAADESDLRVGMVVRVEGDFDEGNTTGRAARVRFEDILEGPIETGSLDEAVPGQVKTFTILGQSVTVDALETVFDDGATFAGLAADDVLEVSGFVGSGGEVEASRVSLRGTFPADSDVDLIGTVANLVVNPDESGMFDVGSVVVRFTETTPFTDVTRIALMNGDRVKVEGTLRPSGSEIDANEVELDGGGLGAVDLARVEIEGVATACSSAPDFCVGGTPVDISMATFEPVGFVPMIGDRVEVEGALVSGTLEATLVESEDDDPDQRNVRIEAAVTSVDTVGRSLVVLGVTIAADGDTLLEDDSEIGDESFAFEEVLVGDFVEVLGFYDGSPSVRALSITRDDANPGSDDVRLEGPVTALDRSIPTLDILGQPVEPDAGALYFDQFGVLRTEEEFFRTPGDVVLGDVVRAEDRSAADLSSLSEVDELEIEDPL